MPKTTLGRQTTPSSNFFLHSINRLYNIFIMNYFSIFFLGLWSVNLLNWVQGKSNKYKHTLSWGSTSSSCKTKKQTLFSLKYTSFSLFTWDRTGTCVRYTKMNNIDQSDHKVSLFSPEWGFNNYYLAVSVLAKIKWLRHKDTI